MKNSKPALYLFSPYCLLRPTTNRIFDVRLVDAFAGVALESEIIYPYTFMKDNISSKQIESYYGVKHHVKSRLQYTPLREHSGKSWRTFVLMISFFFSSLRIFVNELFKNRKVYILSRDVKILIPPLLLKGLLRGFFKVKIVYLAPEVKSGKIFEWVIRRCDGIIAGTTLTKERIQKVVPLPEEKFALSLAPVPIYEKDCSKSEARKKIQYHKTNPLIVYTGKLGLDIHEVKYILQTAKLLPDYQFLFTGGRPSAVDAVKNYCIEEKIDNVILTGFFTDSTRIRSYQLAADVLVSYYTSKDHMVEYNYPQKINEYLSTKNPVVTPDFPATKDVLNNSNVLFVAPDQPEALAKGIKKLIEDPALSNRLAQQAFKDIQPLSFPSRAAVWLRFLEGV